MICLQGSVTSWTLSFFLLYLSISANSGTYLLQSVFTEYQSSFPMIEKAASQKKNEDQYMQETAKPDTSQTSNLGGGAFFTNILSHVFSLLNIKEVMDSIKLGKTSPAACFVCKFGVSMLHHLMAQGRSSEELSTLALSICKTLKLESERVCYGVVEIFKDDMLYVFQNTDLSPHEVCGVMLGYTCSPVHHIDHNWTLPLTPKTKPPLKSKVMPKPLAPVVHVLHLSDSHFDPYYKEGSNAECGEPLCCRITNEPASHPSKAAGKWGDYRNCDMPLRTLESMLKHVTDNHKIDYVIWTGDIPPHDIWKSTQSEQIYILRSVTQLMRKYLKKVPIFPALGNHESAPVDSFPLPEQSGHHSISWLYDELAKLWSPWLPKDARNTIEKFTIRPKNPLSKTTLIYPKVSILKEWWLLLNSTDPAEELQWLIQELQTAELQGEKVHIIGHIPPGSGNCIQVWSHNYYRIINRFENTVVAQFFGHTHNDEFEVFYDEKTLDRPTNIAYIGPSVTTYGGGNPAYRIYTVDGNYPRSSRAVLDHETYYLNITEVNLTDRPMWEKMYSAKQAFRMKALFPSDWDDLIQRFEVNDALFQKFYRYFNKLSDFYNKPCVGACKAEILCNLRSGRSHDPALCKRTI
ncbi:sphingomyelin phosphodiesterase-like [Limulus polyphemus]|uniref:Sphingomyelin phosphodiesterase n=1 Tax=Limulus polyphemus TaxID=6850 RepID=A0ABM1SJJ2_LIMPO|nr:sphingomyelin phosphodiesterase-like [Limulus polyphemus]